MKKCIVLSLFVVVLLSVSVCSAQEYTFTDGIGREVSLSFPVQRIAVLAPSLTEVVCEVGGCELLAGIDLYSDYPADIPECPFVTNPDMSINYEALVSVSPDLVLAAEINSADQIRMMENLGLSVYYVKNPNTFPELYDCMREIGALIGKSAEGEALAVSLEERVQAVTEALAEAESTPRVYYELDGTDPSKPWTTGSGTFITNIIGTAGGENIFASESGSWLQVSQEALLQRDPEVILLGDAAYGTTKEIVNTRSGWESISAVRNDAIYEFDDDLVSRPGPRLVDGLEQIAWILHPECFETTPLVTKFH